MEEQKDCGMLACCGYGILLLQMIIGIMCKSNSRLFKDSDKNLIPITQLKLCGWPLFGYALMLIVRPNMLRCESVGQIILIALSCFALAAQLYKKEQKLYLICLGPILLIGIPVLLAIRAYSFTYWVGVIAHGLLCYVLWASIKGYLDTAKIYQRRTGKNYFVLVLQTLFQICLILFGTKHTGLSSYLLVIIGLIECIIIWLLDCLIKVDEPIVCPEAKAEEPVEKKEEKVVHTEEQTVKSVIEPPKESATHPEDEEVLEKCSKPPRKQEEPVPEPVAPTVVPPPVLVAKVEATPQPKPPEKKEVEEVKKVASLPVEEIQPVIDLTAPSPGTAKEPIKIMRIIKSNLLDAARKFVATKSESKEVMWKNVHFILALDCSGTDN